MRRRRCFRETHVCSSYPPSGFFRFRRSRRLELVSLLRQSVSKLARDIARFVLVEQVLDHKLGKVGTIDAARHIVPRRDRAERTRVVVESDGVIETGGLGGQ